MSIKLGKCGYSGQTYREFSNQYGAAVRIQDDGGYVGPAFDLYQATYIDSTTGWVMGGKIWNANDIITRGTAFYDVFGYYTGPDNFFAPDYNTVIPDAVYPASLFFSPWACIVSNGPDVIAGVPCWYSPILSPGIYQFQTGIWWHDSVTYVNAGKTPETDRYIVDRLAVVNYDTKDIAKDSGGNDIVIHPFDDSAYDGYDFGLFNQHLIYVEGSDPPVRVGVAPYYEGIQACYILVPSGVPYRFQMTVKLAYSTNTEWSLGIAYKTPQSYCSGFSPSTFLP